VKSVKTLKDVRLINRKKILRSVYFEGPLSRLEICKKTGLSPATVGNLVGPIIEEGIVLEQGFEQSSGGRRRVILDINPDFGYFIGVDIGHSYIQFELFNFKMKLIGSIKDLFRKSDHTPQRLLALFNKNVDLLLAKYHLSGEDVHGLGITLPGVVDAKTHSIVWSPFTAMDGLDLGALVGQERPYQITVDNGSRAMAVAEQWFGGGKNINNMISLILGRGIGAGIVVEGQILRGKSNFAGEWGHTSVTAEILQGESVEPQTIESQVNLYLDELWDKKKLEDAPDPLEEMSIFENLIKEGDAEALKACDKISRVLGVGIANLINVFNPEVIILGGWIGARMFDVIYKQMEDTIKLLVPQLILKETQIRSSDFNEGDICIGGACLALESYLFS